ncbi:MULTISPECIES: alpha/beta fold hydrolase [unclassified Pseudonocardia]|uniref:alpha/beta fold hydrolase n=1 Tax=unclassified Pseudonocardia TaxID=2619320 RepID=UPI00094AE6FA|nr:MULTISPECIES: alpha/beta hydrolase [unclassified Pseudonocardia]OLL72354.1 Beta-ketoadipate enol-lactone hydrolase [Pseudonocardia sp. Ae150A_Ps1]OLL92422.1 Beta-ketoadipate enol-lactone hydrolase [Pseudonocardia sp. Ae356_Ps1]
MSRPADVVLLHGVGLDHTLWDRVAPELSAAGHTVHAPDLLGHGSAPDAPAGTTLADLAAPVAEVVAGAGGPVHLVGFSLGALVATRVALDHPGRVARLTLVSGVAGRSDDERAAVAARLGAAGTDLAATFDAAVRRWFSPEWTAAEPELADRVRRTLAANRPSSYLACYAVFARADAELWPELPRLVPPVTAVTGPEDPGSTPAMTRALAGRIPHGRAVVVDGARHLLPLERPDAVLDLLGDPDPVPTPTDPS